MMAALKNSVLVTVLVVTLEIREFKNGYIIIIIFFSFCM